MNILVLNGSPAGKDSITLQTVEYLKIYYPDHTYEILHVGQQIRSMERDFTDSREKLEAADLILFCYPVYTFLVPAQLHRFIELIKENGVDISGKYATQLTTSKHFYDTTAHRFIADNCADLRLRYIRGLSADMEDLLTKKGQQEAKAFFRFVLWNIKNGFREPVRNPGPGSTISALGTAFIPVMASDAPASKVNARLRVALVTDYAPEDESVPEAETTPEEESAPEAETTPEANLTPQKDSKALRAMICRFQKRFPGECEIINLREFPFSGGCLGCFRCASEGKCVHKDGFDDFLRSHINNADAVVYAYTIRDHSMGYRLKLYDDRQFCNGHRTVTMGKPVGYLVDGDLCAEENLRVLMEARAEVGGNFLAGVASDQQDPDGEIDQMVRTLVYAVIHKYTQPKNFYGVGGLKIFRDLIFEMQGLMKEDHRFYKEHGFYDFPQKKMGKIAGMYLVGGMMTNEKLRKKIKVNMTDGMMMAYRKVLEKAEKDNRKE